MIWLSSQLALTSCKGCRSEPATRRDHRLNAAVASRGRDPTPLSRISAEMTESPAPTTSRRVGRQLLTAVLAVITLGVAGLLGWATVATPLADELPELPDDPDLINDLPANLTWLLLIGVAVVAWRQLGIGIVTAVGCAAAVLLVAYVEVTRYAERGHAGSPLFLIGLIAVIEAGSFLAVGVATGVFGWHQRAKLRAARRTAG